MNKKLAITEDKFSHETSETILELIQAADKNILILSVKRNKEHITTSFTKADLQLLIEFLKTRGIE